MEKILSKSKKFDFLKENKEGEVEKNLEPNYDKRFGLNQSNSKIKNNLTDCLMRFLFFSRATFFRRCLQRAVLVVIFFFVVLLISCIDSEGNLSYNIKVNASEFIDTVDYSNIEKLWEQPLSVVQRAVYGNWRVLDLSGHYGPIKSYNNTFAKITRDSIIVTLGESEQMAKNFFPPSPYKWEKVGGVYATVWDEWDEFFGEYYKHGWKFYSISEDTLYLNDIYHTFYFKFLRVKK